MVTKKEKHCYETMGSVWCVCGEVTEGGRTSDVRFQLRRIVDNWRQQFFKIFLRNDYHSFDWSLKYVTHTAWEAGNTLFTTPTKREKQSAPSC